MRERGATRETRHRKAPDGARDAAVRGGSLRRRSGGGQQVADPRHRQQQLGLRGVRLKLLAQHAEVDAQVLGVLLMSGSPDVAQQLFVGQDLALVPGERGEQAL